MKRLSNLLLVFAASIILYAPNAYTASTKWPLGATVDLSSGFGDPRPGRFHAGVDLRTGGKIGRRVLSPVEGYVYRVKTSYTGAGKALYIMGDDNFQYVFGHLSHYADPIDQAVTTAQLDAGRYYLDVLFPRDSIRVNRGQRLGASGQTGGVPPHLHFEKRTADNRPINPLAHGFELRDTVRPILKRIEFVMTDSVSLFEDGTRKLSYGLVGSNSPGVYTMDTVLFFNHPFGMLIEGSDRTREGGMDQAIYELTVYVDDRPIYQSVFDSLDFETGRSVGLEYDWLQNARDERNVRRLYHRHGNQYAGSRPLDGSDGTIGGRKDLSYGRHRAKIVAEDCSGNLSELIFDFVWGPGEGIAVLDSVTYPEKHQKDFYFTPAEGFDALEIDSLYVQLNAGLEWRQDSAITIAPIDNGRYRVTLKTVFTRSAILRLAATSRFGCQITGEPFNGIIPRIGKRPFLDYEIVEGGLLFKVRSTGIKASELSLAFKYRDSLLGFESPRHFVNRENYYLFVPVRPEYAMIDRVDVHWEYEVSRVPIYSEEVALAAVGFGNERTITFDSLFFVKIGKDHLFEPQYIEIDDKIISNRHRFRINSRLYTISPEAFATRKDFEVSLKINRPNKNNDKAGLCWLDEKKDAWVWLEDNRFEDNVVTASSMGGGRFAAVIDFDHPTVDRLNLIPKQIVNTQYPEITFRLIDSLSGIADDQSIDIRIDRQWMIPEYNPATFKCKTRPVEPLQPGDRHLAIIVTDRCGRKTEKYLIFEVAEGAAQQGR